MTVVLFIFTYFVSYTIKGTEELEYVLDIAIVKVQFTVGAYTACIVYMPSGRKLPYNPLTPLDLPPPLPLP